MNDEREPRYIALDLRAYRGAMRLKPRQKLEFFDGLFDIFNNISNEDYQRIFENDQLGDLLRDASKTMHDVYNGWKRRAFANPSGLPKQAADNPIGVPNGVPNGMDTISSNSISLNLTTSQFDQLKAEGYKQFEIDNVVNHSNGYDKDGNPIKDPIRYIRQAINHNRSKNLLPIQNYEQRSYAGEQKKALELMMTDTWGDDIP
jgi:hypothetical protein